MARLSEHFNEANWQAPGIKPEAMSNEELAAEIEWTYLIETYGLEE